MRMMRRFLRPAYELAGKRAGFLSIAIDDLPLDDGCHVTRRTLQEPLASRGKIEGHLRAFDAEPPKIDDIDIGFHAGADQAAIDCGRSGAEEEDDDLPFFGSRAAA